MLAYYNIDIMTYLRSTLRLHFCLIDPRLRWTFNLPYLLLLSVFDLGKVLGRLKILNFVVIDSLDLDLLRLKCSEQVGDGLIVRLNLAIDRIDSFDILISLIAETVGIKAVIEQEDKVFQRVATGQNDAVV